MRYATRTPKVKQDAATLYQHGGEVGETEHQSGQQQARHTLHAEDGEHRDRPATEKNGAAASGDAVGRQFNHQVRRDHEQQQLRHPVAPVAPNKESARPWATEEKRAAAFARFAAYAEAAKSAILGRRAEASARPAKAR